MHARHRIKNTHAEYRAYRIRMFVGIAFVAIALLVVIGRLFWLQVVEHEHYLTLSQNNRQRIEPVAPTRGLIYDRNGVLLARNVPTYALTITPDHVQSLKKTIKQLSKLIDLRPVDIQNFYQRLKTKRAFQPVVLRSDLSSKEVATFAVNRQRFPGVDIRAQLKRKYPLGAVMGHITGYVGAISKQDLQNVNASEYGGSSVIGKSGIERSYEKQLHGHVGEKRVEVNAQGRVIRTFSVTPPTPGDNIYLSIDAHLQSVAYKALGQHRGAVVAIDPDTGEILAMVSKPSYDPNMFIGGISHQQYKALHTSPGQPLYNRAIRGQYPPGSTIKPFMGLAALYYGAATPQRQVFCPGYFKLPNNSHIYHGWRRAGHGWVNLRSAITQSCDVYFYEMAVELGINHIHDFLAKFGFGQPTGIDIDGERDGLNPSPQWKKRHMHQIWFPGETVIVGIGQGYFLSTPLQLASATATLAARGKRFVPHLVHAIKDPVNDNVHVVKPKSLHPVTLKHPSHWHDVISAMVNVVNSYRGTAHSISGGPHVIAGKTGTAQVYSISSAERKNKNRVVPKSLWDHALFIAFSPAKHPKIAVAVIVEHGGHGGSAASPIVRTVIDAYFDEASS